MDQRCPYCRQALDRAPKRKTACQHCGNPIYVRTKQTLFPSSLLTDHQVAAWELFAGLSAVYDPSNPIALPPDHTPVTVDDYHHMRTHLTTALGREPFATEVVWHLAKKAAEEAIANGGRTLVYIGMAIMLHKTGHDHVPVYRKHFEQELRWYKNQDVFETATVRCNQDACQACIRQDGQTLTIDEALRRMPLPCVDCNTVGLCRCNYEYD